MSVDILALTTTHERYSWAAIAFLAPLPADCRVAVAWVILVAATFANHLAATFANHLAAIPIVAGESPLLPIDRSLGIADSVAIIESALPSSASSSRRRAGEARKRPSASYS